MFRIPDTLDGVKSKLLGASKLATGAQWEIAAYIWALRQEGVSPGEITGWGIVGLKSTNAVTSRTTAYQKAIDDGLAEKVLLGEQVTLPEADYFDYAPAAGGANDLTNVTEIDEYATRARAEGTTVGMAVRAGRNAAALRAAIKADPKVAEVVTAALQERNAEALEKLAEAGRKAAEEAGVDPLWEPKSRERSELEVAADAMKEVGTIADKTTAIRNTLRQVKAEMDAMVAEHTAVGDSYIGTLLDEISGLGIDISGTAMSFSLTRQEV